MLRSHTKQPASLICRHKKEKVKTNDKTGILGKRKWLLHSNHLGNIIKLFWSAVSVLTSILLRVFYLETLSLLQQGAATLTKAEGLMMALS